MPRVSVGDKVYVKTKNCFGKIRFIGITHFKAGIQYGIELERACGKIDGTVKGRRYFKTNKNSATFVGYEKIKLYDPNENNPNNYKTKRSKNNGNNNNNNSTLSTVSTINTQIPPPNHNHNHKNHMNNSMNNMNNMNNLNAYPPPPAGPMNNSPLTLPQSQNSIAKGGAVLTPQSKFCI